MWWRIWDWKSYLNGKNNKITGYELTVSGFGSRIRLISFLEPDENHDGKEKSAL